MIPENDFLIDDALGNAVNNLENTSGSCCCLYYRDRPHFVIIHHTRHQSNALLLSFVSVSKALLSFFLLFFRVAL